MRVWYSLLVPVIGSFSRAHSFSLSSRSSLWRCGAARGPRQGCGFLNMSSGDGDGMSAIVDTIVGGGRIGSLLADVSGPSAVMVGRSDAIPGNVSGPIFVCTRNDALESVFDRTPESRRCDLVFLQNGYLDDFFSQKGLEGSSHALVYFAVAKKGDAPIDGKTAVNPEGLTAVTGKWAGRFKQLLDKAGLACNVLDADAFRAAYFEKLIWICAYMLVGAKNGGVTVGEVQEKYTKEVTDLVNELAKAVSEKEGVTFNPGMVERLAAYTMSVAHFPTAVKELPWRNGFFQQLSETAAKEGRGDPCPLHSEWLEGVLKK
uniref:Ketopantoate reductase C-terminal domain-containing protein n=1 Tax=Chromera velia CCMP2878 TaxID=1169474 RepID=A0A0G4I1T6_9ALVE|eukprot:Cvel_34815.t1-p1 / transcript=Cvel_34815.t1 / gene=Cvel_34815 / organism=Chromera_velia_CCMP2878 / gene_product=hypothetical protein / transcript_product=hypothetical protein / location=Cvel_scaffold6110:1223-2170(-) / protein_length=316 / sequence_SO=supercontig / SO=protein_coding / is_pseudo=false